MTPHPSSPTASGRAAGLTFVHCPAATRVLSANAPMPRAGESGVPSASVIFCVALWVAKQYQGRPRRQARHSPHTARQLRTTKSPGREVAYVRADRLDDAGGLVAEEEGEIVVDPALAVVEVGVADAARLDGDDRLARPGLGHHDLLNGDGSALRRCDHPLHLFCHCPIPPRRRPHDAPIRAGPTTCVPACRVGSAARHSVTRRSGAECETVFPWRSRSGG